MKPFSLIIAIFVFNSISNAQKPAIVFGAGIEYRQSPIDIEDVPRGPLPTSTYGDLTGNKFWQSFSIHGKVGIQSETNWLLSLSAYTRFNHNHHTEYPYKPFGRNSYIYDKNTPDKKRVKFDLFIQGEKKWKIHKSKTRFLTILAGIGFTNINSRTDLMYSAHNGSGGTIEKRYKGSFLHVGPRAGLGYQRNKIGVSIVAYIIEDELQTNLTAVWAGISVSYDIGLRSKKKS